MKRSRNCRDSRSGDTSTAVVETARRTADTRVRGRPTPGVGSGSGSGVARVGGGIAPGTVLSRSGGFRRRDPRDGVTGRGGGLVLPELGAAGEPEGTVHGADDTVRSVRRPLLPTLTRA
jgi:hypothetical protein